MSDFIMEWCHKNGDTGDPCLHPPALEVLLIHLRNFSNRVEQDTMRKAATRRILIIQGNFSISKSWIEQCLQNPV